MYKRIACFIISITLSTLACTLGVPKIPKTATLTPIPVTTKAVQTLQETVESVATQVQETGQVNLTVDESQLTSYVALELSRHNPEQMPIQDPQVHLQNGQVQITGNVIQKNVTLPAEMILSVSAGPAGKPIVNIESAKVGPLPVPKAVISDYNDQINQAFLELLDSLSPNTFVESITISDGKMTITGHTQ